MTIDLKRIALILFIIALPILKFSQENLSKRFSCLKDQLVTLLFIENENTVETLSTGPPERIDFSPPVQTPPAIAISPRVPDPVVSVESKTEEIPAPVEKPRDPFHWTESIVLNLLSGNWIPDIPIEQKQVVQNDEAPKPSFTVKKGLSLIKTWIPKYADNLGTSIQKFLTLAKHWASYCHPKWSPKQHSLSHIRTQILEFVFNCHPNWTPKRTGFSTLRASMKHQIQQSILSTSLLRKSVKEQIQEFASHCYLKWKPKRDGIPILHASMLQQIHKSVISIYNFRTSAKHQVQKFASHCYLKWNPKQGRLSHLRESMMHRISQIHPKWTPKQDLFSIEKLRISFFASVQDYADRSLKNDGIPTHSKTSKETIAIHHLQTPVFPWIQEFLHFFQTAWISSPEQELLNPFYSLKQITLRFFRDGWIVYDSAVKTFDTFDRHKVLVWLQESSRRLSNDLRIAGHLAAQSAPETPAELIEKTERSAIEAVKQFATRFLRDIGIIYDSTAKAIASLDETDTIIINGRLQTIERRQKFYLWMKEISARLVNDLRVANELNALKETALAAEASHAEEKKSTNAFVEIAKQEALIDKEPEKPILTIKTPELPEAPAIEEKPILTIKTPELPEAPVIEEKPIFAIRTPEPPKAPAVEEKPVLEKPSKAIVVEEKPVLAQAAPEKKTPEPSKAAAIEEKPVLAQASPDKPAKAAEPRKQIVAREKPKLKITPLSTTPPLILSALFNPFPTTKKPEPDEEVYYYVEDDGYPYPLPKKITLRHIEGSSRCGSGFALASNYSTLEMLIAPDYRAGHFLPMIDLRGHRFDNDTYGANFGIIARYIPEDFTFCRMLGVNAYYDYRQGSIGYFQQVGVGIEVLGRRWDFRANVYAPFGAKRRFRKCVFDDFIGDFIMIRTEFEAVSYGFNCEVGYYFVRSKNFTLYGAAGPYYIAGREGHLTTRGGEVRLRPQYKDYIALEGSYRHDPVFESVWQLQIIFTLPLYQISTRTSTPPCRFLEKQIYQSVERFEVMPLGRCDRWFTNF